MSAIMIRCPNTGQPIFTGIETDERSFSQTPEVLARMHCPVCGVMHAWWRREAWLTDAPPQGLRPQTAV